MKWEQVQLKYVARFAYGDALPRSEVEDLREGPIKVFGSNGPYTRYSIANTGAPAIIVGRKGSYGKVNWSPVACFASDTTFFVDNSTTHHHLRWLFYVLQTLDLDKGSDEAAVPGLNRDDAYARVLLVPSLATQRAIAAYLDRETTKIDAMIDAKQWLLALLSEKRRALITHAVTRGLDPDAPMRDSGVPWIGRVPAGWEVVQLRNVCESLQTGPFGSQLHAEDYIEDGIPIINPTHLVGGVIIPDKRVTVDQETVNRLAVHKLEAKDVIFARRGEIGRCALVTEKEEGWLCGSGSLRVRLKKHMLNTTYLVLLVLNTSASVWLSIMSVGTTMDNLNTEIIGSLPIPLPSLNAQEQICETIQQDLKRLTSLEYITDKTITLLHERRAALIAAAVTGQITVTS